ncbi:biotin-dependent carboxyltransferase family protein [Thalassobellus sediminis]|uniref:5-oxoprolinase subunit C family protein n=1 Tax=Thalassobellus sediminis TaxID=3367753 RepID=UPI00379DE19B
MYASMVKVLKAGFYSSIQDLGRFGYQEYGVPYSGVMDVLSASMANSLLDNDVNSAVIEITMTGPTLQFFKATTICISGADISPQLNKLSLKLNKAISVKSGDVLSFGKLNSGFRSYLAISGGFKTEKVMQSQSMYKGITDRFMLSKDDELDFEEKIVLANAANAAIKVNDSHFDSNIIEVFKGPEFDLLSQDQQKELFSKAYSISKDNNRMAYQLEAVLENDLKPIITSPVLPGTVQLTPSGKLIVLMRDCQTTGGYPRVLQLKESAINVLSQKYTGQSVLFELV